jgi:hypothetical protein
MKFNLFAWIIALWQRLRASKPSVQTVDRLSLKTPELQQRLAEVCAQHRRDYLAKEKLIRDYALAEAKTGRGPQPWDRDWYERCSDVSDEIYDLASAAGWQWVQEFIEVLDWALASPQGQQAQVLAGQPSNPWRHELELIAHLRTNLVGASRYLLREQARQLDYSEEWDIALESALRSAAARAK